jgi:F-type H+-transporting ATPase subunit O
MLRAATTNLALLARRAAPSPVARYASADAAAAHRPPLDLYGLTARYANATYVAASKASSLDAVEAELLAIKRASESSAEFRLFLENPLVGRDVKARRVEELLRGKTTGVTLNLMTVLAGNARLGSVGGIADDYVRLMKARRGEVEATITSAEPLTKAQGAAVSEAMSAQFPKGAKVVLKTNVDPAILGGLQIQIGDKFLDLSVASRIDEVGRTVV